MKQKSRRLIKRGGRPPVCPTLTNKDDCESNLAGCSWNVKTSKCTKKRETKTSSTQPIPKSSQSGYTINASGEIDITIGNWNLYIPDDSDKIVLFENPGKPNRNTYTVPIKNNWKKLRIIKPDRSDPNFEESVIEFDLFYFRVSNSGIFELTLGMEYTLFFVHVPTDVANLVRQVLLQKSLA